MSIEEEIRSAVTSFAAKYGSEDLYGDLPILGEPDRLISMLGDLVILFAHLRLLGYDRHRHYHLTGGLVDHLGQIFWAIRSAATVPFVLHNQQLMNELDRLFHLIFLGEDYYEHQR